MDENKNDRSIPLTRWEIKILKSLRKESKNEKKIAKDIALDSSVTAGLVTGLMEKGYIERSIKRRRILRSTYIEQFAITADGLAVLEVIGETRTFLDQITNMVNHLLRSL